MGEFLSYSLVSGLLMLAMFLAYRLFLASDNQHGFNRGILLLIYAVSFAAVPLVHAFHSARTDVPSQAVEIENFEFVDGVASAAPMWGTVLIWIFIAGMVIVTVRTVITWLRLTNVVRHGQRIESDGFVLVVTDNEKYAPFSWVHYVVVSRSDYESNCSAIVAHEVKHIKSVHWFDLLLAQVVCIINWFNPAAWLMRDELMLVHEYQADMAVIDRGHDVQEYQRLLIKKAVGSRFPSLANSLNHSKLKKRITMMYKEKSGAGRKLKALALVPMFALALGVASVPTINAAVSAISSSDVTVGKDSEKSKDDKEPVGKYKVSAIYMNTEETTLDILGEELGNNLSVSGLTLTTNGKTYKDSSIKCSLVNGVATIVATFPFAEKLKEPSLTLSVNGENILFDLESFTNKIQEGVIRVKPEDDSASGDAKVVYARFVPVSSSESTVYLDGEKISAVVLKDIAPETIDSVKVDKQSKTIFITRKK